MTGQASDGPRPPGRPGAGVNPVVEVWVRQLEHVADALGWSVEATDTSSETELRVRLRRPMPLPGT